MGPGPDGSAVTEAAPPLDAGGVVPAHPALRARVLSGNFYGPKDGGTAGDIAHFIFGAAPVEALELWFGSRLPRLLAHDGTRRGKQLAMQRLEAAVDRDIAAIDRLIAVQLDAVLHHDRVRRLEGSWRALTWLMDQVPFGARVKIKLISARWQEICRDFDRASEFDQSALFRTIYEGEFGTPGGEPFSMLLADYEVRHAPGPGSPTDDVAGLDGLAAVAAASFSPTVIAAHPALVGFDNWAEVGAASDIAEPLRGQDRLRWRSLQARDDTRFLCVVLPRMMARAPWADDGTRADRFRYREYTPDSQTRIWCSPGFALAAAAVRSYAATQWPADIRGASIGEEPQGGVIATLPVERAYADPYGAAMRPPLELSLTDDQERQAVEGGLIPFIGLEGLGEASFGAMPSIHVPPRMTSDIANANQRLSAQFNALLCVSRFAHCVKLMGRDMVGSFQDADTIQRRLQAWLQKFADLSASTERGAKYPLREAMVDVAEKPGKPGVFGCVIHLQPHYQLDEVGASFRLVTDLQAARAA
ncbi:MAG TPA: type VI secretion system contractile sheath large subunit [Roseomonas sp.]